MCESPIASPSIGVPWRGASIVFALIMLAMPAAGDLLDAVEPVLPDFLTPDQIPAARDPEERIAAYAKALESATKYDFIDLAVDFSARVEPEEALASARELAPTPPSAALYEDLGAALLVAGRGARLGHRHSRAAGHLRAARHAFALADKHVLAGDAARHGDRGSGLLHRAMIGLEAMQIEGSEDAWEETAGLLARLKHTSQGPLADWAERMLRHPETYAGEEDVGFEDHFHIGGDIRRPAKIFTPPPRISELGRKFCGKGVVIIQTVIDRHGNVAGLRVLKGLPLGLDDDALRAVGTWLFEPATLEGKPITVFYNLVVKFGL